MAVKKRQKNTGNSSTPTPISRESRRVLSNVLRASDSNKRGVDIAVYRVRHKTHWELLEGLERDGYLRKDSSHQRYLVSLLGLSQISAKPAKTLLANMEKIFSELRKSYTKNPHAKVFLFDLVKQTGLLIGDVRSSLEYMTEMSISNGQNIGAENTKSIEMYILPNESVASPKYRRFRDMIRERLKLNEAQKNSQQYGLQNVFIDGLSKPNDQHNKPIKPNPSDQQRWYRSLKPGIRSLMGEINLAINAEARSLAAMGLRAVVDMACNDVLGDVGGFGQKLTALQAGGHITVSQGRTLGNALELGHAAAHRGHVPNSNEIEVLRDIVEHMLKQFYLHEPASEKLRRDVPVRQKASPKRNA